MSYIKTKIVGASEVKAYARVSKWVFVDDVILAIITLNVLFFGIAVDANYNPILFGQIKLFMFIGLILLVLTIIDIVKEFLKVRSTELALTDNRIIGKTGILGIDILDSQLESYDAIQIKMSLVDRLIGTGRVIIFAHGNNKYTYHRINKPLEFQKAVNNMIDQRKRLDQKVIINRISPTVENDTKTTTTPTTNTTTTQSTTNTNDNATNAVENTTTPTAENVIIEATQVVVQ